MKKTNVKKLFAMASVMTLTFAASISAFAASQDLNNGGGTWSGGENADGILYSKVVDNKNDGIRFHATVWVKSDDGAYKDKTGTTNAVGNAGKIYVSKAATHKKPTVTEKCGYKNYYTVR